KENLLLCVSVVNFFLTSRLPARKAAQFPIGNCELGEVEAAQLAKIGDEGLDALHRLRVGADPGLDVGAVRLLQDAGREIALGAVKILHDGGQRHAIPMRIEVDAGGDRTQPVDVETPAGGKI